MVQRTYIVDGMTCSHCVAAVSAEVGAVAGVASVAVDLGTKRVVVTGPSFDDASVRAAVDEAGYDAVSAEPEP